MPDGQNLTPTPERGHHIWRPAFLSHLSLTGNVTGAARAAGVSRTTVYEAREADRDFALAWDAALAEAADLLEQEARRRAVEGVDDPVIYQGELMGCYVNAEGQVVTDSTPGAKKIPLTVKRYSDTLLIFLLKGNKPEKFKDRQEHSGPDGQPLHIFIKGASADDL